MFNPLVTIIVACYNHENYINDCLDSIIAQTYKKIEIIIGDDCSSDNSLSLIKNRETELKLRFGGCTIISNKNNLGLTKNLNNLLKLAHGDYIKGLASDDMLVPTAIEEYIKYFSSVDGKPDILYSNIYEVDSQYHFIKNLKNKNLLPVKRKYYYGKGLADKIISDYFIQTPGVIFPKETFAKYGCYNENNPIEDLEFFLRVSLTGEIAFLDKALVLYRVHNESMSHFAKDDAGFLKYKNFEKNIYKIYLMYSDYFSKSAKELFFNQRLNLAICYSCNDYIDFYVKEIKKHNLSMRFKVRFKKFLYDFGILKFFTKSKNLFKLYFFKE